MTKNSYSTFAGCSEAALAARAALAMPARAAIFFWGSDPGCTTPADCNLGSAAFDPDNYNCTGGICEYKGCNNDDECIKTYSNSEYLCR